MTFNPININVTSHPENLKRIRKVMREILVQTGFSKKESGFVVLAIDEACSNIIRHGYKNDYHRKIDLTVRLEKNRLIISIMDDGVRFDETLIKTRDVDDIKPGGLGIYIIHQVMDSVEYSRTHEGFNRIKMVKNRHP